MLATEHVAHVVHVVHQSQALAPWAEAAVMLFMSVIGWRVYIWLGRLANKTPNAKFYRFTPRRLNSNRRERQITAASNRAVAIISEAQRELRGSLLALGSAESDGFLDPELRDGAQAAVKTAAQAISLAVMRLSTLDGAASTISPASVVEAAEDALEASRAVMVSSSSSTLAFCDPEFAHQSARQIDGQARNASGALSIVPLEQAQQLLAAALDSSRVAREQLLRQHPPRSPGYHHVVTVQGAIVELSKAEQTIASGRKRRRG